MSDPWPSTLPQKPLFYEYKDSEPDNAIRQPMEVGPPKIRLRSSSKGENKELSFVFTSAEKAIFKTLYQTTLKYGSLPYEWADPETGTTYDWVFTNVPSYTPLGSYYTGSGYTTLWKCKFSVLRKI